MKGRGTAIVTLASIVGTTGVVVKRVFINSERWDPGAKRDFRVLFVELGGRGTDRGRFGFLVELVGSGGKLRCSARIPGTSKVTTDRIPSLFSTFNHD